MTISLGVIYLDGYFQDDDMVFSSKYFLFNKIFTDIVQISMNMLFMLDIDLIFIPILFDDNGFIDKISLEETFNLHPNVDQFIFSGTTIFVNILIENYFRYYPEKILYCVNSSQSGSDFNDNIIRLLPNDYGLNNFIANLYLRKNNFDLFYFTSSEYTKNDGIIQEGQLQINTTKKVIDDFLVEQNRQITTNPILFSLQNPEDFYNNMNINMAATDYYSLNYYTILDIPYVPNEKAINDLEFSSKYADGGTKVLNRISDKGIVSYNNGIITYSDKIIPQIEKFIAYLINFKFESSKKIVVYITYSEFPILLSKLSSRFTKKFMDTMSESLVFILSNIHNIEIYSWDLFNDPKTDTLWYNQGYTWYELLSNFEVKIHIPRVDQSMFHLYSLINDYLKNGVFLNTDVDLKLGNTSQPALEAVFNALQLIYHFNKNNINIRSYISSYFQNARLLQFNNNIVFNNNMDSIYGLYVATTYFFENEESIGTRNVSSNVKNANAFTFIKGDECRPVTTIIGRKDDSKITNICVRKISNCDGFAHRVPSSSLVLKNVCFRCLNELCKSFPKGGK